MATVAISSVERCLDQALPAARGPLTGLLFRRLLGEPGPMGPLPGIEDDPLSSEDLQLALYACYELHYRGFAGVHSGWEWEPSLLEFRRRLEEPFEHRLMDTVHPVLPSGERLGTVLFRMVKSDDGPPLARYLERQSELWEFREFVVHRSAYQLKEADPHSWAIPRLTGRSKAALVEIQTDEYGGGRAERMHATLFQTTMRALGLDSRYGAYLDAIPAATLATVNLISMFGLHRRWRGAVAGHLAVLEMTSSEPNRRYSRGLRRLGLGEDARHFYDEHVEADAVHEVIAAHDLAGSLSEDDPSLTHDILFGASACLALEARFGRSLLESWSAGRSSLRSPLPMSACSTS